MYKPCLTYDKVTYQAIDIADLEVEPDINNMGSGAPYYLELVQCGKDGTEIYEKLFHARSKLMQACLFRLILQLTDREGRAEKPFSIHCRVNHCIAYTRSTLAQPFERAGIRMIHGVSIDEKGHVTNALDQERWLTGIFEKA